MAGELGGKIALVTGAGRALAASRRWRSVHPERR